jgi:Uma2 family endonuclease
MSPTDTLVSLDEYLSTVYDPDCEYVDGELIERNMGEFDHSALQGIIFAMLYAQGLSAQGMDSGFYAYLELRVQVAATRYLVPDITVTTKKGKGKILREPPVLCIEILSPEDRVSRMEGKIDDFLSFGVKHVWLIDPRRKNAWSYTSEGKREPSAVLTTSDPRITLALDPVFAKLADYVDE